MRWALPFARLSLRFRVEPCGSEAIQSSCASRNMRGAPHPGVAETAHLLHVLIRPSCLHAHAQMVVVQSTPSTSNPHRKNRRSLSKSKKTSHVANPAVKPPPTAADDEEIWIDVDVDGADVAPPTEAPVSALAPASAGQSLKSETRRVSG